MKRHILILIVITLAAAGCDRTIESKDPVRSIPDPPPTPFNIQVAVNAETIDLEWTVFDSSNISRYRIYVADTLPVDFRLHDSSTNSAATLAGLLINRLYYIQIAAVAPTGIESERATPVSAIIGYSSILINGGAQFTNDRNVVITVNSSALASQVVLSEDSTFADAYYIPYAPTRTFALSFGDGLKIVYGRLVFADGSVSGNLLEDAITLDTQAEIDSVFILPSNTTFAGGQIITFGLDAGDLFGEALVSFTGVTSLELFDNGAGGDDVANDGVYHGQYEVPINSNLYRDVVTGSFTDGAGNQALPTPAVELLNINTPPDPVVLGATINLGQVEFTWTLSQEPDFQSYRIYSSPTPTVTTASNLVAIETDPLVSLHLGATPAATTYYKVYVFDLHGASAGSDSVRVL